MFPSFLERTSFGCEQPTHLGKRSRSPNRTCNPIKTRRYDSGERGTDHAGPARTQRPASEANIFRRSRRQKTSQTPTTLATTPNLAHNGKGESETRRNTRRPAVTALIASNYVWRLKGKKRPETRLLLLDNSIDTLIFGDKAKEVACPRPDPRE